MNALRMLSALEVKRVVPSGDLRGEREGVSGGVKKGEMGVGVSPLGISEVVGFGRAIEGGKRGDMVAFML